ncbi:MAG: DMT family transporter [Clostridium sp.]
MAIWIGIAVLSGMVNIMNRMINLEAKKRLGLCNGTMLNYVEATILSLIIAVVFYGAPGLNTGHLSEIPPIYFIGGVLGLISMVLMMIGMSHVKVVYATVIALLGQLGAGVIVDSIVEGHFDIVKVLGVIFIVVGVLYDKKIDGLQRCKKESESES